MAKIKNYYAGSNSSLGFYSLYHEALKDLNRIYILKGGPGTGKSTFMRKIGLALMEKGLYLEYLHCSSDNKSIDGLLIPSLKVGLVDGTSPHVIEPRYPGVVEKYIDLGLYRDDSVLNKYSEEIISLTDEISANYQKAYETFAEAKKVHLKKEDIYLSVMDFDKANEITQKLMEKIFEKAGSVTEKEPKIRSLFFGAATPKGAVNFIENLTEDIEKRFIIKGRPGSGKSTMLKKIGARAQEMGLSVEYYPCALDPKSLDMIILPSLSVAIMDGTAPHVVDPFRLNDEVVDMFTLCMDPNVEVEREAQLQELETEYKNKMQLGTNFLCAAKQLHDQLEEYYKEAMNFEAIDKKREEVWEEINQLLIEKV